MGEKPVTDLPGVGEVLGKRFSEEGYDLAYVVLGQYLLFKKNKPYFQDWMKELVSANAKQSGDCFDALDAWQQSNL